MNTRIVRVFVVLTLVRVKATPGCELYARQKKDLLEREPAFAARALEQGGVVNADVLVELRHAGKALALSASCAMNRTHLVTSTLGAWEQTHRLDRFHLPWEGHARDGERQLLVASAISLAGIVQQLADASQLELTYLGSSACRSAFRHRRCTI